MSNTLTIDLLQSIYGCASSADSMQQIASTFYDLTGMPTVIADSLHHIIALSPDIQLAFPSGCAWGDLVDNGYVLPLQITTDDPAPSPFGNASSLGSAVSSSVLLHCSPFPGRSEQCVMCDIHHNSSVLMKLAVTAPSDDDSVQLVTALASSLYTAWFRLRYTTNSIIDAKSRFLLSLLKNGETGFPYGGLEGCSPKGPYVIVCLPVSPDHLTDMSHYSICDELSGMIGPSLLSVFDDNEYVFLICDVEEKHFSILEDVADRRQLILGLSHEFTDLSQASQHHLQARGSAITASHFSGFTGLARFDDMKLFLMFDMFYKTGGGQDMVNPQVEILAKTDEEKNTGFMRTLFCWLLCSQRAAAAASLLGVHRNTLDNRLAKINELIDADWNSCTYSTCMLYSLYITMDRLGQLEFFK